jgi:hypothetical protein
MIRKPEKYSIDQILPLIGEKAHRINLDGDKVNVFSTRLQTFKNKGINCVACGLKGQYFVKEKSDKDLVFHINLFGVDKSGREVMFTKDHIIPKSKGGKDKLDNLQTMCERCNTAKRDNLPKNKIKIVIIARILRGLRLITPATASLVVGLILIHANCVAFGWTLTAIGAYNYAKYMYGYFRKGMDTFLYLD